MSLERAAALLDILNQHAELVGAVVSLVTLLFVVTQVGMFRRDMQVRTYFDQINRVGRVRNSLIANPNLGTIFEGSPELEELLAEQDISVQELFWILEYLTTWESFFYQRRIGMMPNETWEPFVNTVRVVIRAPRIKAMWQVFRLQGTYRPDWSQFLDDLVAGRAPTDPRRRGLRLFG